MKRLLPVFVVIFLFLLVSPINMITTGHQVFAAPEGTGGIVLVARDIGDGKTGSGNPVTHVYPSMGTYSAVETAPSSPEVTWVWPADGYMDAGRMTEVVAVFRDAMNASSIGATNFTLRDRWGNLVSGTVTYDDYLKEAVFTPDEALFYGRTYTARLDGSIKDALGQSLGSDYEWTFQVELGPYPVYLPIIFGR